MSDRERWIVYPLLFLALGAALRDKLLKQTRAKDIVCEHLFLVDAEGRPAARLTGAELVFDQAGQGNGYIRSNVVEADHLSQRGQPVLTFAPPAGMTLQQLLELIPQPLRMAPGAPPHPSAADEGPGAQDRPRESEPLPAAPPPTENPPAGGAEPAPAP